MKNNRFPQATYESGVDNAPTENLTEAMMYLEDAIKAYGDQIREENRSILKISRANQEESERRLEESYEVYRNNPLLSRQAIIEVQKKANQRINETITLPVYAAKEVTTHFPPEDMLRLAAGVSASILDPAINQTIKIARKDGRPIQAEEEVRALLLHQEDISQYEFGSIKIADFFTKELTIRDIRRFIERYQYDFRNGHTFEGFYHLFPLMLLTFDYGSLPDDGLSIVRNARTFQTWVIGEFISSKAELQPLSRDLIKLLKNASGDLSIKVGEIISRNLSRFGLQHSELFSIILDAIDKDPNLDRPGRKDRSPAFGLYKGVISDRIKAEKYISQIGLYAQDRLFMQNTSESKQTLEGTLQILAEDLGIIWEDIVGLFNHTGAMVVEGEKSPILKSLGIKELEISQPVYTQESGLRIYILFENGHREMFTLQHPSRWNLESFEAIAKAQKIPVHSLYKLTAFTSSFLIDFIQDIAMSHSFPDTHKSSEFARKLRTYLDTLTILEKQKKFQARDRLLATPYKEDRVVVDPIAQTEALLSSTGCNYPYQMSYNTVRLNLAPDGGGRINPQSPEDPISGSLMRLQISSIFERGDATNGSDVNKGVARKEADLYAEIYGIEWNPMYASQLGVPEEIAAIQEGENALEAFGIARSKSRVAALELIINNVA